jgi:hypothetical protein
MHLRTMLPALVLGITCAATAGDAFAGKKDASADAAGAEEKITIQKTGLASMDQFFGQVEGLLGRLDAAQANLQKGTDNLNIALGLASGTPLADAFTDLQTKAQKKVAVALDGRMPRLKATDAVPDDVQKGIDAVNALVEADLAAADACQQVIAEAQPLAQQAPGMVARVPGDAKAAGLKVTEIPAVTRKVKHNVDVTVGLPGEAQTTLTAATANVDLVSASFSQ